MLIGSLIPRPTTFLVTRLLCNRKSCGCLSVKHEINLVWLHVVQYLTHDEDCRALKTVITTVDNRNTFPFLLVDAARSQHVPAMLSSILR